MRLSARSFPGPASSQRKGRLALCLALLVLAVCRDGRAQEAGAAAPVPAVDWRMVVDGQGADWPLDRQPSLDSLQQAAREVLASLQREGFYLARIDSVTSDRGRVPPVAAFYATRGPRVTVGRIRLEGVASLDSLALLRAMDTRPGRVLDPRRLEADLDDLLARYEEQGRPLAQAVVEAITLLPGDPSRLGLTIRIEEGPVLLLRRVEVAGKGRTRPDYLARLADLHVGRPLTSYDPEAIQQQLEATGLFKRVGTPELYVEADSGAVLRIPLDEEAPGSFDLVLGYQPAAAGGGGGGVVGNGHLVLSNLFGTGRGLSLRLNRLPGQVSSVDVRAADPFVLGLPLQLEIRFEGLQQDSTFSKQRYGGELGYRIAPGFQAFGTLSREGTEPGQAGLRLQRGRQQVAQADAWFAGVGFRFRRLDRPLNPRRGLLLETNFERGRKERLARQVTAEGDTTEERLLLRQERLRGTARLYLPTFPRQVAAFGAETSLLLSNEYDRSDLFRFGGATSLRGYDEAPEHLLGRFIFRAFAEYRYQVDRSSYVFLFSDLGYRDRPALGEKPAEHGFFPGYGMGIQFGTDIGLINASYAANTTERNPLNGRIHVGLSIGL